LVGAYLLANLEFDQRLRHRAYAFAWNLGEQLFDHALLMSSPKVVVELEGGPLQERAQQRVRQRSVQPRQLR
jgi:hypothetical protein